MESYLPIILPTNYSYLQWGFTVAGAVMGAVGILGVALGQERPQLTYSKWGVANKGVSSRVGMFTVYFPAFVCGSWYFLNSGSSYSKAVSATFALHFGKRVLESLFVHKYSGGMTIGAVSTIVTGYTTMTYMICNIASAVPAQIGLDHLAKWSYLGYALFGFGIFGNLYHHILLRNLRSDATDKQYKAPVGGLFGYAVCPHYFLEWVQFIGMAILSGQGLHWSYVLWTFSYFFDRSNATLAWYKKKIPNFDKNGTMKRLIPFLY